MGGGRGTVCTLVCGSPMKDACGKGKHRAGLVGGSPTENACGTGKGYWTQVGMRLSYDMTHQYVGSELGTGHLNS